MSANMESPGARILAGSLRRARENANMSLRAMGKRIGVSYSVISYWETAQRIPSSEDVASFLTVAGVTGEARARIVQIAKDAETRDYLATGVAGISQQLNGVMECERTAELITDWSPLLIPGLLQTTEYARSILGTGNNRRQQVEAQVTLRAGRLTTALDRRHPPSLDILIGEPAIRRCIGGNEAMARQLQALVHAGERNGVSVRVVPDGDGWHPGLMGPFILYEFPTSPAIVHLEHHRSGAFIFDNDDIAEYKKAAEDIRELTMSRDKSAVFIKQIAKKMERG